MVPTIGAPGHQDTFALSPRQIRRIPLCCRRDGARAPLELFLADPSSRALCEIPDFAYGTLQIQLLGGAGMSCENLNAAVNSNGALNVWRAKN
jgi:hypothetical protein